MRLWRGRAGRLLVPALAGVLVIAIVVALTGGVAYAVALVVVAAIVLAALTGVRAVNTERGRDASRSSDAPLPHHGFDDATPLGDTDQHAGDPR